MSDIPLEHLSHSSRVVVATKITNCEGAFALVLDGRTGLDWTGGLRVHGSRELNYIYPSWVVEGQWRWKDVELRRGWCCIYPSWKVAELW